VIQFKLTDVAATADAEARTIEGMIVPYNEVGRIAGVDYRFLPGSVRCARSRTPLLIDHDRGRPVGVLAELTDTDRGAVARFKIDDTPDGNLALQQAASGSRGALSVGATVDSSDDNGGVLDVTAGLIHEVSLLALGAFDGATVLNVAAEFTPDDPAPDDPPAEPPPETEETPMPDDPAPPAEAAAAPPMILAERPRAPRELSAGQYVQTMLQAQQGDRAAREIMAALTETISTDIAGLLPPTYEQGVIGPAPIDRVLYDTFKGKPIPAVGLTVQKPTWTTFPNGTWAATVDDDATTGKAVIGLNAATIERWDWATAISYTAAKRSSPDAITTIYGGAVENFYVDVETKIAALVDTTAGTPNAAIKFGAGIAAFYTRCGRAPEVLLMAPDVWGVLADAGALSVPFGVSGAVIAGDGGLRGSYAGLPAVASAALAAGTKYLATRRALDVRVTEPVQLTANAIGALNVEFGVVGEGIFDADVALEVMELAAGAPVGLEAAAAKSKG
jgi:Escherichia/Staphylococcus phage prohead protease